MGQAQVDQGEIGQMFRCGGDRAVQIVGGGDDPITRIVLDQIFQRRRQLDVVFDDQDLQHRPGLPVQSKDKSLSWKGMVLD